MEEEEKYRIIRHQVWSELRNAKKILRHTDVYYWVVVGRLDLDLNPLHLLTDNPVFTHAHWFVPYPYLSACVCACACILYINPQFSTDLDKTWYNASLGAGAEQGQVADAFGQTAQQPWIPQNTEVPISR